MRRPTRRRRAGKLITFEGIEGCGKSTPGGTELGEALRTLLLRHTPEAIDPRSELFLYLAARSQLVARVIEPALADGGIVLADRFGDASVASQGGGRKLGPARVRSMVRFATGGIVPDRTYLLDLSVVTSLARVRARGGLDRLEGESLAFHRSVRDAYRRIAEAEPERVRVLRGRRPPERIAERIHRDLMPLLRST